MSLSMEQMEQAFRRDPADADAFAELRRRYQAEGRTTELAALLERRAAYLHDSQRAADMLVQAAELRAQLPDPAGELRLLQKAIERSSSHPRALEKLKGCLRERAQWDELLRVLDLELETLHEAGADPKRISRVEHEAGKLWEQELRWLDRAVAHYQKAFKANPENQEAIEAGRRIYRQMGSWSTVVGLLQIELSAVSDSQRRVELLLDLAQLQWKKLGDLEASARSYTEANQLRPGTQQIQELLGSIYASPEWPRPGGLDKAASIFIGIAQRHQDQGDLKQAVAFLRRALEADPENEGAFSRLERTYREAGHWQELNQLYQGRLVVCPEAESRAVLMKRAEVLEQRLDDRPGARACYEAVLPHEPLGGPASSRLAELCRLDQDWRRVVQLLFRHLDGSQDRQQRIKLLLEIAAITRDQLGDADEAAHLCREVLQLDPVNSWALLAYEDYFRQRGDHRNLAELLRFAAQVGVDHALPLSEITARIEELADISERRLGDLEGAVEAWQRLLQLVPDSQKAEAALQELGVKLHSWQDNVFFLERELELNLDPSQRLAALRRLAQARYENLSDPRACIQVLEEILDMVPEDEHALRMLVEIYERSSDFEGLTHALKRRLSSILTRAEQIEVLRRLVAIHLEKLDNPREAQAALQQLLDLEPTDSKAYSQLVGLLERSEDLETLARVMSRRIQASGNSTDRLAISRQLSRLMDERLEDPAQALSCWQAVAEIAPYDDEALAALCRLYERGGRYEELLETLRRRLALAYDGKPTERVALLRQNARVADQRLDRPAEAAEALEELLQLLPADREGLEALVRLYGRLGRTEALAGTLERQLEQSEDAEQAVVLALKLVDVLEQELGNVDRAIGVLDRLVQSTAPGDLDAHRRLKQLYLKRGAFAEACAVAEREFFLLAGRTGDQLELALTIARLWQQEIGDERQAALCYERVLSLDPRCQEALEALRQLYPAIGSYLQLVRLGATLLDHLADPFERKELLLQLAAACEGPLGDPEAAFEWYREAFRLAPQDGALLQQLRQVAGEHGLWEELIATLLERRKLAEGPAERLALTQAVAAICRDELDDPARGLQVLQQGLELGGDPAVLFDDLEQLAQRAQMSEQMTQIYGQLYEDALELVEREHLLRRRARWAELKLNDPHLALQDMLRLSALRPEDEAVVAEIERLAGATGHWEEIIAIYLRRLAAAAEPQEQAALVRHVAALMERSAGDLVRAFRATLQLLRLEPDSSEVQEQLWRLARLLEPALDGGPDPLQDGDELTIAPSGPSSSRDDTLEIDLLEPDSGLGQEILVIESVKPRRDSSTISDPTLLDGTPIPPRRVDAPPLPPSAGGPRLFCGEGPMISPWAELSSVLLQLPASAPDTRVKRLLAVADVWEEGARDVERAFAALGQAAAIRLDYPELRQRLEELAARHNRPDRLLQIYRESIEREAEASTLGELHLRCSRLLIGQDRWAEAEPHLSAVLALQIDHEEAAGALRQLLEDAGRWEDLAAFEGRQLQILGPRLTPRERQARLGRLADLYQNTLKRPFDAVEILNQLLTEDPLNTNQMLRLADLYQELAIWPRLIEIGQTAAELLEEPAAQVNQLLRVAQVMRQELELPERAVEIYRQVLDLQPREQRALEALSELYSASGQLAPLQEVLEQRLALVGEDPFQAPPLLLRLADILLRLEQPARAIDQLRRARAYRPEDLSITTALVRTHLALDEAAAAALVLESQIDRGKERGWPAATLVPLAIQLALLRYEQQKDVAGCRLALEQARTLAPRHPALLSALADFFHREQRWPDYVEILSQLSEVDEDAQRAADRLLVAARIAATQLASESRAIELYEAALERLPASLPAVEALLASAALTPERREQLLKLKLELVADDAGRAQVLTGLALVHQQRQAEPSEVTALLERALQLDPGHLPALRTLARLHVTQGALERARTLLGEGLRGRPRTLELLPFFRLLGEVLEQLKRPDEAYRCYLDALRLNPEDNALRAAAGLNRFRAHQWREALRHLQEVVTDPEGDGRELAAEAFFAAARCEQQLRRDDRASAYYLEALKCNPGHRPSLQQLLEMARDRGKWDKAATYARQLLEVTQEDPARRALLLDLAQIHLQQRDDLQAAAATFEELLHIDGRQEADSLSLLPLALPVLRRAGRHLAAAEVAEQLAVILADEQQSCEMHLVAAACWSAGDQAEHAEKQYRAALGRNPGSLQALAGLTTILRGARSHRQVTQLLTPLCEQPPALDPPQRQLFAELMSALGQAHAQLGEGDQAIVALEQSVLHQEDQAAREQLALLYQARPDQAEAAALNHRRLLQLDPVRVSSLTTLARASADKAPYRAYLFYQALAALEQLDEAGRVFLADFKPPELPAEDPFAGELSEDDRTGLIASAAELNLQEVFVLLWQAAPTLLNRELESLGVSVEQRVSPVGDSLVAQVLGASLRALGLKQTVLYLRPRPEERGIQVVAMAPPVVIVDQGAVAGRSLPELRFLLGRALELTHPGCIMAAGMTRPEFAQLFSSVLRAFHPRHLRGRRDLPAEALEQAAALRRILPFKISKQLGEFFRQESHTPFDSGSWRQAVLQGANRVGLVLSGDLAAGLRLLHEEDPSLAAFSLPEAVRQSPAMRDLLAFFTSDAYYACRAKLGLAGGG